MKKTSRNSAHKVTFAPMQSVFTYFGIVSLSVLSVDVLRSAPIVATSSDRKEVRIAYGLQFTEYWEFERFARDKFPFFREYISGGCVIDAKPDPEIPTTGKRYVCPECVVAWKRFLEEIGARGAAVNRGGPENGNRQPASVGK
jgi:hypothetical protein